MTTVKKKVAKKSVSLVNPHWQTSCLNWEELIVGKQSINPVGVLFASAANGAMDVFDDLDIVDAGVKFGDSLPWVRDFASTVFGSYCDTPGHESEGRRLIKSFFMLIPKKNIKALALDTPIPTPYGWTTMGELKPGDTIYGVDGKPCRVIAESEIFINQKCFRVGFSNGESVVAGADHRWVTKTIDGATPSVRTTEQVAASLLRKSDGARNHSMRMPEPIQGCNSLLPIAPYTLGAWLGDGHSACAKITAHRDDEEILDAIRTDGYPVKFASNNGSAADTFGLTDGIRNRYKPSLQSSLRAMGLLNNKHIPAIYFRASYAQRLALLQGLMDTDGCISKNGRVLYFSNTNARLAQGVADLLATMGVKHTLTRRPSFLNGKRCADHYDVQFNTFRDHNPVFRLTRKLERMRHSTATARSRTVQFTSVDEIPTVPLKCVTVDSPDHQFLFGRTMLPTHNSTLGAGIMLTLIIRNWRNEAEFIILAPTKEVADNSFKPIKAAIDANDELRDLFQVQTHIRTITHNITKATLKVVAADSATVSGKKASVVLIDELHEFGKVAKAEDMLVEATGGLMSRPEGCVIYLTTQSSEPPAGVFKKKLDYARQVRDGKIDDPTFLPIIYEYPSYMVDSKAWKHEANWGVVNPNLGISVDIPTLRQKLKEATASGEDSLQSVISKHFNIQIGLDLGTDRWPGADYWLKTTSKQAETLQKLIDSCEVLTIGIDGGGFDDLLGLTVSGRVAGTIDQFLSWSYAWVLKSALELRKEIADRLRDFERVGEMSIVDEAGVDVEQLVKIVKTVYDTEMLYGIGVDPARMSVVTTKLKEAGVPVDDEKFYIKVSQGWRLFSAILFTERALMEGRLQHTDQALMNWCVGNCKVVNRSNALLVTKEASGKAKIDPVMALFNSMELMSYNPESKRDSWDFDNMRLLG